jgi:hypothetical protein
MNDKKRTWRPSLELIVTVVLQLVAWVFSAGMGWQKMTDLEKSITKLSSQVEHLQENSERAQLTRK